MKQAVPRKLSAILSYLIATHRKYLSLIKKNLARLLSHEGKVSIRMLRMPLSLLGQAKFPDENFRESVGENGAFPPFVSAVPPREGYEIQNSLQNPC